MPTSEEIQETIKAKFDELARPLGLDEYKDLCDELSSTFEIYSDAAAQDIERRDGGED